MIVLGLNFGHDAGACVVQNGKILAAIERERLSRTKHALSLDFATVDAALRAADVRVDDIDYCAVTSTQRIELVTQDPQRLTVIYETHEGHVAPSPLYDGLRERGANPLAKDKPLLNTLYHAENPDTYFVSHYFPEYKTISESALGYAPYIDGFATCDLWNDNTHQGLEWLHNFDAEVVLKMSPLRHAFHYPLTVILDGRKIPGYYIYHHQAHAASAYYPVNINNAAIFCHDGGKDDKTHYNAGMIFLGEEQKLIPVTPHHLGLGRLYEGVAQSLALGMVGGPGKLMGLTSYGKPKFFDDDLVGNRVDWEDRMTGRNFVRHWLNHCEAMAQRMGYDTSCFADEELITDPFNADIAASTQHLFEEILLRTVAGVHRIFSNAGIRLDNLCYAGGIGLNCPANVRLHNEGPFKKVHIPPWCDDGGLAIGAALAVYHNIFDNPLRDDRPAYYCAYLGREASTDDTETCLHEYRDRIRWTRPTDPARDAAQMLAQDKIIGWMEGRSEIGPRALGHRSIFANVTRRENWERVNRIKGREQWRPLAPLVLEEDALDWFRGGPTPSPHMLFTSHLRNDALPAITHVDGTARVQTVRSEDGQFHDILVYLKELTGIPVMMNTSFNGPGEPIVDAPEHALRFFLRSGLDAVYLNGIKVEHLR